MKSGPGSVDERLSEFLERETLLLTVLAALGRNPTYREDASEEERRRFRKSLKTWLRSRMPEYRAGLVDETRHVDNIEALSAELSVRHGEVLLGGRLRIGTAQKALNLYLKYGWARGIIHEPPHCPIDSIVLAEIKKCPASARCGVCENTSWTKIDTRSDYLHLVNKARAAADARGLRLAHWELEIWQADTSAS